MDRSPDYYGDLSRLKADFECAKWEYRELSRRLDEALYDERVSVAQFERMNMKRTQLLNRMKVMQAQIGVIGYG